LSLTGGVTVKESTLCVMSAVWEPTGPAVQLVGEESVN